MSQGASGIWSIQLTTSLRPSALISPGSFLLFKSAAQLLGLQALPLIECDGAKLLEAAERHGLEGHRLQAPRVTLSLWAIP